ncbi:MAG: XTP/dITP diphosphatase [Desulfurococcales archaeon]|nr:XTP/dITP diphosphatase [Desulfurococcales archaeon]
MLRKDAIRMAFITSNKHKLSEANSILKQYNVELYIAGIEKIELQDDSLETISKNAAINAYNKIKSPLVTEDSGLFIESLKGFPGPYSSYTYKTLGVQGIIKLLEGMNNRKAYYEAVVTCVCPPFIEVFKGRVYGRIAEAPRGSKGFGFDPIFIPRGYEKTFGELGEETKNKISHRARAFSALGEWITSYYGKVIKPSHRGS